MFEFKHEKLAPLSVFVKRMAVSAAMAGILIAVALLIGIMGYHHLAGLDWVDSILEASMILGGMGPVNPLVTTGAKMFAAGYALFSGLVFIAIMGIVVAPITHRMLHQFHIDDEDLKR
ncbi:MULTISPECIES: hypothetical protein [Methylobacter]|uniref:hypothetical protein n=1 Tax=Methylobacter TaxID=429 RepID=UPI001FAB8F83|nr:MULTISPECIES: hypothetical protein [Methylobacter]UOA10377.1 hypothetical protein KKZ03_09170 [Methylobacter sp. S3L5C]